MTKDFPGRETDVTLQIYHHHEKKLLGRGLQTSPLQDVITQDIASPQGKGQDVALLINHHLDKRDQKTMDLWMPRRMVS